MRLDMRTRRVITKEVAKKYIKVTKKGKGIILDEFTAITGYRINRAAIFRDHADQKRSTQRLREGLEEAKLSCCVRALIRNHFHANLISNLEELNIFPFLFCGIIFPQ